LTRAVLIAAGALVVASPAAAQRPALAFPAGEWVATGVKAGKPFVGRAPLRLELTVKRDASVDGEFTIGGRIATPRTGGATGTFTLQATGKVAGDARRVELDGADILSGRITAPLDNPLTGKRTYHTVHFQRSLRLETHLVVDSATCRRVVGRAVFRFGAVTFTATRRPGSKAEPVDENELVDRYGRLLAAYEAAKDPANQPADLPALLDQTNGFLSFLAQARGCGTLPPDFAKGLRGLDELMSDLDWVLQTMLMTDVDYPSLADIRETAEHFDAQTWADLLDLAQQGGQANRSAPRGSDPENAWQRFGVMLDKKLDSLIAHGPKSEIRIVYEAATSAGMTTLAARAKDALDD
jgi:hypothetical protein